MNSRLRPPAHRVSARAMAKWAVELLLGGAVLTGCSFALSGWAARADWTWRFAWLPWFALAATALCVLTIPYWRYRVHRWEISSDVVYLRIGALQRQWLLVPVSRIQTVDAQQSWLERLLRLATLRISTASHEGSSELSGLPLPTATSLAAELAHRAHALRDDAT
ncbi:PH domain-containing protein [Actinocorallia sp. B10E7]|uniref:PH domain-containing protein n=1 Tax=Actinocorallia sp. B10E7 TaxID=3153558 RepID=UPI00325DC895